MPAWVRGWDRFGPNSVAGAPMVPVRVYEWWARYWLMRYNPTFVDGKIESVKERVKVLNWTAARS